MTGAPTKASPPRWPRRVEPELLDELPVDDPRAVRSRADLRRVNHIMRAHTLLVRSLDSIVTSAPLRLVELGAGDGTGMLRLARSRARQWPGARVVLLDMQPVCREQTLADIRALGWEVEVISADACEWLAGPPMASDVVMCANLFVHHFQHDRLASLLAGIARQARCFVCLEPRRAPAALVGSHLLGLIGCNAVTRHDAVVSVHAGFRDHELSTAWTRATSGGWQLAESAAGPFTHRFVATRSQ